MNCHCIIETPNGSRDITLMLRLRILTGAERSDLEEMRDNIYDDEYHERRLNEIYQHHLSDIIELERQCEKGERTRARKTIQKS